MTAKALKLVSDNLAKLKCSADLLRQCKDVSELLARHPFADDDPEGKLVEKALMGIAKMKQDDIKNAQEKALFENNCSRVFDAICTFNRALRNHPEPECTDIERKLFRVVFSPTPGGAQVYPVYQKHDEFLQTHQSVGNFKSSTGSGKTRCAPFFFALRAHYDHMERPFFIMTQPGASIIKDKMKDFRNVLGDSVELVSDVKKFTNMWSKDQNKPVIGLFSPHSVVKLIARAQKRNFPLVSKTRFCLDEIHERSVEADVMVALLADGLLDGTFPLHILMMSATPDPRVESVFRDVKQITLADSQLFPIEDIRKESESYRTLDKLAVDSTMDIITRMSAGKLQRGHILVFTSGNKRMKSIIEHVEKDVTSLNKSGKKLEILPLPAGEITLKGFHKHVKKIAKKRPNVLFIVPMKYAGYVSQAQQEIGKSEIPDCPNVIKVIAATNSIESSITIVGLAAVVDCGVCNMLRNDNERGVKMIEEGPISKQSQIQRRGRVGRVRDGVCVQITIKGHPPVELRPPAIEVEDISSNILSLRQIGIRLETITNLPMPGVSDVKMRQYLKELQAIGALDQKMNLTETGKRLASFTCVTPFVASAILSAAEKYKDDSSKAIVVGTFAFLVMTTENLFVDPSNPVFRKNFCKDSDVFTLMSAIIKTMQQGGNMNDNITRSGFHPLNAAGLINAVDQLACTMNKDEKSRKARWKNIEQFYKNTDMFAFVRDILENIEKRRPSWVSCRRATFAAAYNCLEVPKLLYTGDNSLAESPEITVTERPGWRGLEAPGSCLVMQISKSPTGHFYGVVLHRDSTRPEVSHPISMEVPGAMNLWQFAYPLVGAYLKGSLIEFGRLNTVQRVAVVGLPIFVRRWGNKAMVTYIPKEMNDESKRYIEKSIRKIEKLMPYTPRCLLVQHRILDVIVAITSYGDGNFNSKVFHRKKESIGYAIDKTTIDYLVAHIGQLSWIEERLLIAMTADDFFFSMDDDDDERAFSNPWVGTEKTVFGRQPGHLVILSKEEIPGAEKLQWGGRGIHVDDIDTDFHVFIANTVWRGTIRVAHNSDMIFGMRDRRVEIKGEVPPLPHNVEESRAPIGRFFDRCAMYYAVARKLAGNVKLMGFSTPDTSGQDIAKTGKLIGRLAKNYPKQDVRKLIDMIPAKDRDRWRHLNNAQKEAFEKRKSVGQRIDRLKTLRQEAKELSDEFTAAQNANDRERLKVLREKRAANKNARSELGDPYQDAQSVNAQIDSIKHEMDDIWARLKSLGIPFADSDLKSILSADWTSKSPLASIPGICFQDGIYTVKSKRADCANVVETMQKSGLTVDRIPLMTVTISHRRKGTRFEKKEDFTEAVKRICTRFGGIVASVGQYHENESAKLVLGQIVVSLYTYEFLLPFVGELTTELSQGGNRGALRVPLDFCPLSMLSRKEVQKAFSDWATTNRLTLKWAGPRFVGSEEDLARGRQLLSNPETRPVLPFKIHTIPGGMNLDTIGYLLKKHNQKLGPKKGWTLVRMAKALLTPVDVSDEDVKTFLDRAAKKAGKPTSGEDLLFDYVEYCEENAECSGGQIPVYRQDGSVQLYTFCVHCCHSLLSYNVGAFFDVDADKPIMERVCQAVDPVPTITALGEPSEGAWPAVPLGQLLWMLVSEGKTKAVTKTWFSAKVFQALRASQMFESCPVHAAILLPVPAERVRVDCPQKGCEYYRCPECMQWHKGPCTKENVMLPPGFRTCPHCKRPSVKVSGCNRITCNCGKHFCYYCGFGPTDTSAEVYAHLSKEHGGYFNDPPDYKRYIVGQSVPDEELNAFYEKYPQFRPQT